MDAFKYSKSSNVVISGATYLDPILNIVFSEIPYRLEEKRPKEDNLIASLYPDHVLYQALNNIAFGKTTPTSRQATYLIKEGIRRGLYNNGNFIEAVLCFDTIRIESTLQRIRTGEYDPRNPEIVDRLRRAIKRGFVTEVDVNNAIKEYKMSR